MLHDPLPAPDDARPLLASLEYTAEATATALSATGFAILPALMPRDDVALLDEDLAPTFAQTPFCQGGFYGAETKRFGRLLTRSSHATDFIAHPLILQIAERILGRWCDTIQLNLAQAISIHPGAPAQFPHRDQDMWRGDIGTREYLINVMWPFTDYSADNGATLLWPNSHGRNATAPDPTEPPIVAEMAPGSALIFLGSTLHGAGCNATRHVRRGMIVSYCLGWLKPYENQWLAYPPTVARHFPADVAGLVGYRQHRPNLGNFEGQCPSILLRDTPDRPLGAVDALRPDQAAVVERFVADQRRVA